MLMLRDFFGAQVRLSRRTDRRLFPHHARDGNKDFLTLARDHIAHGSTVADVGGGKTPLLTRAEVEERAVRYFGVDIDPNELACAPAGVYAATHVCDVVAATVDLHADVVLCQSILEHVRDNEAAFRNLAGMCKPGGLLLTFCPSRRALFAILNRWLPQSWKRRLLFSIFPEARERHGFPAFYDRCTPREFIQIADRAGFDVVELRLYFASGYLMFFWPLYALWRLAYMPLMVLNPKAFCETFAFVFRKRVT
jgi:SAM-dependent methyltransferase